MPRQKLIAYFFAFLAAAGLAMYGLLPEGSEMRLLGIVLLIFCLPIALRYALRNAQYPSPSPSPSPVAAPRAVAPRPTFGAREVNLTVEGKFLRLIPTNAMRVHGNILDLPCLLVLGSDGFSSRLWRVDKITGPWPNDETLLLNAEFLVPERALPHFPAGTIAHVLLGNTAIGSITVLRNHAEDIPASNVSV